MSFKNDVPYSIPHQPAFVSEILLTKLSGSPSRYVTRSKQPTLDLVNPCRQFRVTENPSGRVAARIPANNPQFWSSVGAKPEICLEKRNHAHDFDFPENLKIWSHSGARSLTHLLLTRETQSQSPHH